MGHKQDDDAKRLKDCLGCRVVRYCGKVSGFSWFGCLTFYVGDAGSLRGFLWGGFFLVSR